MVRAIPARPIDGHRSSHSRKLCWAFLSSAALPLAPHPSSVWAPKCPDLLTCSSVLRGRS